MWKKKEQKKEENEENLLKVLCGDDAKLYEFLGHTLYLHPLEGISEKGLDILTEEAEESRNYGPAVDKAIFEYAQHPGESERYIKIIQNLASKAIHAMEQEKEKVEKEGLTDQAASLGRRIEEQKFMIERAKDIMNVASKFYNEELVKLGEDKKRDERRAARIETEREERRIGELEQADREARKKERRKMGREEKREAEKQDKIEELAIAERKEATKEARIEAEREDQRIGELEEADREARKKERRGD